MQMDIELKTLKIMLAIEQEGSISKAAKVLYVSQPALTQYIKRMESTLSFLLYNRENGKCTPTKAGKVLLKEGKVLLKQYDAMLKKANDTANSEVTDIQLGWATGYTIQYLNSIMSNISHLTSLNVQIIENTVESLIELLLQKKITLLLIPAVYFHPDLVYTTIRREEFYLAVPKNHIANRLIKQNSPMNYANLSVLKDMPFISLTTPPYIKFIAQFFEEAGYNPNIIFNCTNWYSSHSLVEDGLGLSFVPYWFAEKGHEKINYYHIQSKHRTSRILACVLHRNQVVSPKLKIFIDHIKEIYGDQDAHIPFDYSNLSQKL